MESSPRLDKYELLEELGHGGMATVYRARDRRLGREVAVKVIHRHLRDEREVKERFAREAKAVAKLRHPNIVEVYDVSEPEEAERYLVVELVSGPTLRQVFRDHAPLPPEIVLGIGVCLADALEHAHEQGVIHRDIKPENVLLEVPSRARGDRFSERAPSNPGQPTAAHCGGARNCVEVKLTDFGIAKVLDVQGVTSTGEVLGSPAHMAPEQIEGQSVGPTADVFSLGVLLYEALVGALPFEGNNPAQVLRRVLEGQFTSVERARPEVGSLIGRLIDRALSHEPAQRFQSAAEFADAMRTELARLQFGEANVALTEYLEDAKAFEQSFVERIVPRIVEQAKEARREGRVALAAALYNRALSLRPGDPEIIGEVARLSRRRKMRDRAVPFGLAVMAVITVAAGGYFAVRTLARHRSPSAVINRGIVTDDSIEAGDEQTRGAAYNGEVPLEEAANAGQGVSPARKNGNGARNNGKTAAHGAAKAAGTRTVQVELRGAKGSSLLIDGVERPWFGVRHELPYGEHRFNVVAPTDNCCVVPEPRVVKVEPGEGELRVVMVVEFRDAQVQFDGEAGATLTCGELFPGVLEAPGRRAVRLTQAEAHGTCTLIPRAESGKRPRTIDVVLRPGGTFTVNDS